VDLRRLAEYAAAIAVSDIELAGQLIACGIPRRAWECPEDARPRVKRAAALLIRLAGGSETVAGAALRAAVRHGVQIYSAAASSDGLCVCTLCGALVRPELRTAHTLRSHKNDLIVAEVRRRVFAEVYDLISSSRISGIGAPRSELNLK